MPPDTSAILAKIFATVFPLVAIVVVGFVYARRRHTDLTSANSANIDVFVPALIFSVMASKSFDLAAFQGLALACAVVVLGSGLLLYPVCRLLDFAPRTFLPPMMFNNSGNLGLPLLVLAFGEEALAAAVILFLVESILHFTLGIFMLERRSNPLQLLRMPIIIAAAAGLVWSLWSLPLPGPIATFVEMLGHIAMPLMLFALGVRMTQVDLNQWRIGLWGALLCPLSGLLAALVALALVPLTTEHRDYLLLFAVLPPAVLNYMMAERYQQQPQQVATIVLMGNMASLLVIPVALFFILGG